MRFFRFLFLLTEVKDTAIYIFCQETFPFLSSESIVSIRASTKSQYVGVYHLLVSRGGRLSTAISQVQDRSVEEDGAKDVGDAETSRQFEHSLV